MTVFDCICKCIHFHHPSTEAFGRLEYIRITDNAGNEFKAQKLGLCQISKFDRNPKFEIPFSGKCIDKLKTYFCPSLTRSLLTRARIGLPSRHCGQNHGAHHKMPLHWVDGHVLGTDVGQRGVCYEFVSTGKASRICDPKTAFLPLRSVETEGLI